MGIIGGDSRLLNASEMEKRARAEAAEARREIDELVDSLKGQDSSVDQEHRELLDGI